MKKLILFAMAISLMACDKDTTKPEDALIGTFQCREGYTQIFVSNGVESSGSGTIEDKTVTISESGRTEGELLYSSNKRVYLKDGVISGEVHKTPVQGTYTFDGKTLELRFQHDAVNHGMYMKFYSFAYIK
jgi:hypothetical protein